MKIKKIAGFVLAAGALASLCAFTACGDGEGDGKAKEYVIEAEYINIADVAGAGLSSNQSGYDMIYGDGTNTKWSSGYYVGYTYTSECKMDFEFTSSAVASATIKISLGSELGRLNMTPKDVDISLNGKSIEYGTFQIENSESMEEMVFKDYTLTTKASLKEGENVITVQIKPNKFKPGGTGGPTIDCIKIKTVADLTLVQYTDNPSHRGAM